MEEADKGGNERYSFSYEYDKHPEHIEVYLVRYDTNSSVIIPYRVPRKYYLSDDYGVKAMTIIVKPPGWMDRREGVSFQDKLNEAVNKVKARARQLNESQKLIEQVEDNDH